MVELNRQLAPEREKGLTVRNGFPPELPDGMDVAVLRVLREALVNVRRHSYARRVEVALLKDYNRVRVKVTDDGRGFNPDYSSPWRPSSSLNFRPTSESSS
ncbi:MAG: hypothetical protein M3392_10325 [Actinomycetota bacterium]|nr:hypothetical protein [Actinomycetota bacterium]